MELNQEALYDKKYNQNEYKKTIFSFTNEELRKLMQLDTMVQMGQIAQAMISTVIKKQCLTRVSIKDTEDTGILYDVPKGQFMIWSPRFLCAVCKRKKATHTVNGLGYCENDVVLLPKEEKKTK